MQGISKATMMVLLTSCSTDLFKSDDAAQGDVSGARLTVSLTNSNDVVGFHFEVERVGCTADEEFDRFFYEENVSLDDTVFPGRIEFLEEAPFDSDSQHLGADFFVALDPGCYVVTAAPASEVSEDSWTPSVDCGTATSDALEVVGGYTTEVTLIAQCEGDLVGALDALVLLNTPPVVIPNIENKFNNQCEPVEVCASGWDPDDDPIEFDFRNIGSHDLFSIDVGDMTLVGYEDGHRLWEQCAEIVTEEIADYQLEIDAYDLAYDEHGAEVRIEDLIGEDSHGFIQLPIHTGWTMSDTCIDPDTGDLVTTRGVVSSDTDGDGADDCDVDLDDSVCTIISDEAFFCSGLYDVDADVVALVCDGASLIPENLYPACEL